MSRKNALTLGMLILSVLAAGFLTVAPVRAATTLSQFAYVAPTLDGVIGSTEWVDAGYATFTIADRSADVFVMNDDEWLYLAVQIDDSTPAGSGDTLFVLFDNDHDRTGPEIGDEQISLEASNSVFEDWFYFVGTGFVSDGSVTGGTIDGSGKASGASGANFFEIKHPLNSTDDLHDFSLGAGSSVGFALRYLDNGILVGSSHSESEYAIWPEIVVASAETVQVLSAWASRTPAIDGAMAEGEWSNASSLQFGMTRSTGLAGSFYVMNDATNLYLLIRIADYQLSSGDSLLVAFDNNADGSARGVGDDAVEVTGAGVFLDEHYTGSLPAAVALDASDGGSSDGQGAVGGSANGTVFEIGHPLHSTDDAHDFSLHFEWFVGFGLRYIEAESGTFAWWPSYHPSAWFQIRVALESYLAPDFQLSVAPDIISIPRGAAATSVLSVRSFQGFASMVTLSSSWLGQQPVGVAAQSITQIALTADGTSSTNITITAGSNATLGSFTLGIVGVSGSLTHSVNLVVGVVDSQSDFSIALGTDPDVVVGTEGNMTATVTSIGSYSQPVTLSASTPPNGVTITFVPNPVTPPGGGSATSTMMIIASRDATRGTFVITVTGTDGTRTHDAKFSLRISSCLIATAAFGSELAPEVQSLREFRDQVILRSYLGSNFMQVFDGWYYSFSPQVARMIDGNDGLRAIVRVGLYPLIWSLGAVAKVHETIPFGSDISALISGLIASSLIGVSYLALPILLVVRFSRNLRRFVGLLWRPAVLAVGAGIGFTFLGLFSGIGLLAQVGTSVFVVAALLSASMLAVSSVQFTGQHVTRYATVIFGAFRRCFPDARRSASG